LDPDATVDRMRPGSARPNARPNFKRRTLETNRRQHRFGSEAISVLEKVFLTNPIPNRETRCQIAQELGVSERQVQVWLQNKRQRSKARYMREAALASQGLQTEPIAPGEAWIPLSATSKEGCMTDDLRLEVYLEAQPPFQIMWTTKDWSDFCGYTTEELRGQTMKIIQGPATDKERAMILCDGAVERKCAETTLINYTKSRIPFRHTVRIEPLVNSYGQVRVYRGVSRNVKVLDLFAGAADEYQSDDDNSGLDDAGSDGGY